MANAGAAMKIRAIAKANRLRALTDRRVLFVSLALPVIVMLMVGLLFGSGGRRLPVGVYGASAASGAPLNRRLHLELVRSEQIRLRTYTRIDRLQRDLRRGRIVGAVVVPKTLDERLRAGEPVDVRILTQPGRPETVNARSGIALAVGTLSAEVEAARFGVSASAMPFAQGLARAERFSDLAYQRRPRRPHTLSPFSYTAPSNLVLFVFITSLGMGIGVVQTRRLGVTRRMLATPTPPWVMVAGQALSLFAAAVVQCIVLLLVGGVLFGVRWGAPGAIAVLTLLVALTSTGAGLLLGTWARTQEQALALAVPGGIALGMLGGCMWSLDFVGPAMRAVGHIFPHAWAMDAFGRLIYRHAGIAGIGRQLAVLAGYAVALFGLATWRLRRAIVRPAA